MTMDQYMEQEAAKDCPSSDKWVRVAQIPLPSFAAKVGVFFFSSSSLIDCVLFILTSFVEKIVIALSDVD